MRFSVVIPCFNSQATVERTLRSCLGQTYHDFEVVAVNNGSTDETQRVLEDQAVVFQEKGIGFQIVFYDENQGPSASRNRGWKLAQGDYVAFLDHDDFWHPQKLEIVDRILRGRPEIDCLGHAFNLASAEKDPCDFKDHESVLMPVTQCSLLFHNFAVTPSVVLKRSLKERFDEKMQFCEDHDLWLRLSKNCSLFYLDLSLVFIGRPVLSQGGQSASRWDMRKGELHMYSKFCRDNIWYLWAWPFWTAYSLLKHARAFFIR